MLRILSLLILVVVLCACNNNRKPVDTTNLTKTEFSLSDTTFSIFLPSEATIGSVSDSETANITLQPNSRYPLNLNLTRLNTHSSDKSYRYNLNLKNDTKLSYNIFSSPDESIGSGGPEVILEGKILFKETLVGVTCRAQQELGKPNSSWCVPYLHHLNIVFSN